VNTAKKRSILVEAFYRTLLQEAEKIPPQSSSPTSYTTNPAHDVSTMSPRLIFSLVLLTGHRASVDFLLDSSVHSLVLPRGEPNTKVFGGAISTTDG
jgi:hypothetical protein